MTVVPIRPARRLTDAELLTTEFRFEDPENISGLNPGVPDSEAHPTIIGYYDLTPPGGRRANPLFPFVRCCHCGKRRHWKGLVVRDDLDETYIIGASRCGREHYGDRFVDAEKAFKEERMRRAAMRRWRAMLPHVDAYARECTALLGSAALSTLELKRDEIKRASVSGYQKLIRHIGTGQELIAHWEERNTAEEEARDRKYEQAMATYQHLPKSIQKEWKDNGLLPERETSPIYERHSLHLGHLVGAEFLTEAGDVRQRAIDLRATLEGVRQIEGTGTDDATLQAINQRLREMTDRPRELQAALHALSFARLFFARDNLDRMARWSQSESRFTYQRADDCLIVEDTSRGRSVIAPFDAIELPDCPTLSAIEYRGDDFLPITLVAA